MSWLQTLETTVSRCTGTYSNDGQPDSPLQRSCTINWNGFLNAGPDYTRLALLEGIIGELFKVISECNYFFKNCISDFCIHLLGFKEKKSLLLNLWKRQSFTPVNYGLLDRDLCS